MAGQESAHRTTTAPPMNEADPAQDLTYHTYGRYTGMVTTKREILDAAIAVLSRGEPLTIDAVARECGLTKPGVVHHFATEEVLTTAVVDRIIERWEGEMRARTPDDGGDPIGRLRAYVDFALTGEFDQSDLALLADVRLRDELSRRWIERLDPWFGTGVDGDLERRARLRAARLLADGTWFNAPLDMPTMSDEERSAVHRLVLRMLAEIDEGDK